jgi:protein TonB
MFEQATLGNGPAGRRAFTTFLGMTSQVAFVTLAVLAPMVFPQALPTARFWESLAPPLPPGPKPLGDSTPKRTVRVLKHWTDAPAWKYEPTVIPTTIDMRIQDEPAVPFVPGALPGNGDGPAIGPLRDILTGMERTALIALPRVLEPPIVKPVEPPPVVVQRLRVSTGVALGQALRKTQPQYPAAAKAAGVSGDVVLECVVGTDGRIQEVKVKHGNPLLVRAAVEAVWQWAYEPTRLNGAPIEVITDITVSFKLR